MNPYDHSLDSAVGAANSRYWWAKLWPYYQVSWSSKAYHCPGYKAAIAGQAHPHPPFGSYAYNSRGVSGLIGYVDAGAGINYSPNSGYGLGPAYYADSKLSVVSEFSLAMPSEMLAIGEARYLGRGMNDTPEGRTCCYAVGGTGRTSVMPGGSRHIPSCGTAKITTSSFAMGTLAL